ncbi:protein RepA [Marinomonas sp. 15G1-11]|uniref:Protein RepA n=2 Tax=Gammaproteobacteria TaxID=1236 RepID=A0ABT4JSK0_9GAMM|nr:MULTISPECIES: RepB family plasmid replication initiator protein [Gammaproteobacteria]MCT8988665.1 replication protein RepA [Shewanella sp. KJ10-1]MCZ2721246.1 protein RepA [Marinomonas sp. 15G1-11]
METLDKPLPSANTELLYSNSKHLLTINSNASVQPNVLLRTGVFTPVGRRTNISDIKSQDLSQDLVHLDLCKREGYDSVTVRGQRLNIETDFKVWCGIVLVFSKLGYSSNTVRISFAEFAKDCGYPSRRFDKNLRRQIGESLERIQSQSLSFRRKNTVKAVHTGMLLRAMYDGEEDLVELMADETLWDLYCLDYQVLVNLRILEKLPRAEVAQCLYLYFTSLPNKPHPVSFERLRDRLRLETTKKEANRKIKAGIRKLESIGYLSGNFTAKNGEQYYIIDQRYKKLEKK